MPRSGARVSRRRHRAAACSACSRSWRTPRTACAPTRWPRRSARARRPRTTCSTRSARRASPSTPRGGAYRLTAEAAASSPPPRGSRLPGEPRRPASTSSSRARTSASTSPRRAPGRSSSRSPAAARACRASPAWDRAIGENAHALALGKVALVAARRRPRCERYIDRGLRAFTPHTIISPESAARAARRHPRRRGRLRPRGVRRGLLLPRHARRRRPPAGLVAALGHLDVRRAASTPSASRSPEALVDVAERPRRSSAPPRFQRSRKTPRVLERAPRPSYVRAQPLLSATSISERKSQP